MHIQVNKKEIPNFKVQLSLFKDTRIHFLVQCRLTHETDVPSFS